MRFPTCGGLQSFEGLSGTSIAAHREGKRLGAAVRGLRRGATRQQGAPRAAPPMSKSHLGRARQKTNSPTHAQDKTPHRRRCVRTYASSSVGRSCSPFLSRPRCHFSCPLGSSEASCALHRAHARKRHQWRDGTMSSSRGLSRQPRSPVTDVAPNAQVPPWRTGPQRPQRQALAAAGCSPPRQRQAAPVSSPHRPLVRGGRLLPVRVSRVPARRFLGQTASGLRPRRPWRGTPSAGHRSGETLVLCSLSPTRRW